MLDTVIYCIIGFLGFLAVCDLFVGVSNDAVNFLNSAVGSKAAPFYVVMIVASCGVMFGATFSSGMMEIAKTGVLVPEMLTFEEVLVVFAAVVVTDVLLLNTFNSLGLPTSTTVAIIFELLGGAVAMACYKVWGQGAPLTDLSLYLNSAKAFAMIMGILISVLVAFFSGAVVQYLLRLIFSFRYEKMYKIWGGLFGGISVTAIFYFLVMKGAKGASFMQPEWILWIDANTKMILFSLITGFTVLFQALIWWINFNVFRIVILAGTFALAFAFAGNDLVNFVGVPLAALDAFYLYLDAGNVAPNELMMGGLREVTRTPTPYLAFAGLVMILTLWFSKKARRVIKTSINLSSSSRGGKEQFGSSLPARVIVHGSLQLHEFIQQIVPQSLIRAQRSRFVKKRVKKGEVELPFDELRASVNLVLAAALIASATSLKLPLSTTYVTFMVAMGSSLADGAWDRESAVYRISGVLTVISGWFLTAFSAAFSCALVCSLFIAWGNPVILAMMVFAFALIVKTNLFNKDSSVEDESQLQVERGDRHSIAELLSDSVEDNLDESLCLFSNTMKAFLAEDDRTLLKLKNESVGLFESISFKRGEYYRMALEGGGTKSDRDARNFYYRAFTSMKEVSHSLRDQLGVTHNYVANCHSPFTGKMKENFSELQFKIEQLRQSFTPENCTRALDLIEQSQQDFMIQIEQEKISLRKSELYLGLLLFTKEMLNRYLMLKLLQTELKSTLKKD